LAQLQTSDVVIVPWKYTENFQSLVNVKKYTRLV